MECYSVLDCSVDIETFNSHGTSGKRVNHKHACVQLGRDQFRDLVFKVNTSSYTLKEYKVLERFKQEGKASVMFQKPRVTVMISNAPPNALMAFLKLMRVKTKIQPSFATDRMKLHCKAGKAFEEISPLTVQDISKYKDVACLQSPPTPNNQGVKKISKVTDITPVRVKKRGLEVSTTTTGGKPSKRLNMGAKPIVMVKLGRSPLQKAPACIKEILKGGHDQKKKLNLFGKLTREQTNVYEAVKKGMNVFYTGSAGTGKSYLLKKIVGTLSPETTVASASTGVAASQIGGVTLHSFAGIGSGESPLARCIELASRPSVARGWKKCQVLIIDEISMVNSTFFDKLEEVARVVRKDDRPFGGIQLILSGDFLQLPPVQKDRQEVKFCFQSRSWTSCISISFELTEVKRQSDRDFINLLQYVRLGKCPDEIYERLLQTQKHKIESNGIQATRLCTHRDSAEQINDARMRETKGEKKVFFAKDSHPEYAEQMEKNLQVPRKLTLKVGAQVMLTKNLDVSSGLVNGARGVITKFTSGDQGLPEVTFVTGACCTIKQEKFIYKATSGCASRFQIPLKLAWAISIHKSQGLTLDCCEVSLSRVFEHGQAYVALSRAKSLEGLRVLDITKSCIKANRTVLQFYIKLRRDLRIQGLSSGGGKENSVEYG